jgi:hypothetical protein
MRNRCWAAALGDCHGPITAEHPISQAIFETEKLEVQGPGWPVGSELPLATLASRSLCRRHNGLLGDDDAAIGHFARSLCALNAPGLKGEIEVDGWALERWCLKALLGIVANGWHRSDTGRAIELDAAPLELAEAAFGRSTLTKGLGLNVITYTANIGIRIEAVSWKVLVANASATAIAGFIVALPPVTFALALIPGDIAALLRQIALPCIERWSDVTAHYRPDRLNLSVRDGGSQMSIRFAWSRSA